ncbi:hypothetical protein PENTCL1PPCAC_1958, partial [Pristionchus entomophagus]
EMSGKKEEESRVESLLTVQSRLKNDRMETKLATRKNKKDLEKSKHFHPKENDSLWKKIVFVVTYDWLHRLFYFGFVPLFLFIIGACSYCLRVE